MNIDPVNALRILYEDYTHLMSRREARWVMLTWDDWATNERALTPDEEDEIRNVWDRYVGFI